MSLQAYFDNKKQARELFKQAIILKMDNPENLPMWKLNSRLYLIISDMNALGYHTTIENIGYRSEGGQVWEIENLRLLHEFTEVLKLKTTSLGYADYFKIYNKLASLEMGDTCKRCKGSGDYMRSSGILDHCNGCNGTGFDIEITQETLDYLKNGLV